MALPAASMSDALIQLVLLWPDIDCLEAPGDRFDVEAAWHRLRRVVASVATILQRETRLDVRTLLGNWSGVPPLPFPANSGLLPAGGAP
jgi:hypothetical protein